MEFGLEAGLVFNGVRLPDFAICGQELISRSPKKIGTPSAADTEMQQKFRQTRIFFA